MKLIQVKPATPADQARSGNMLKLPNGEHWGSSPKIELTPTVMLTCLKLQLC